MGDLQLLRYFVLPDNSSNNTCPSHHCAKFNQYFLENDTAPALSNVEYHLLPEEYYISTTNYLEFTNLQNF